MRRFRTWQLDSLWGLMVFAFLLLMLVPPTATFYQSANTSHPYLAAFVKFMFLATMGELLALRIRHKHWKRPAYLWARALIWGFLGAMIAMAFQLFNAGVIALTKNGWLPFGEFKLAIAFFTSTLMNIWFAPAFMLFHRCTDTFLDLRKESGKRPSIKEITTTIDWTIFVRFVLLRTIPFFWIPAHTINFLLPSEFRVLVAAVLSIVLGLLLAFANRNKKE